MTTITFQSNVKQIMFDDLACGTFFITKSNNMLYLKISDKYAYLFDRKDKIPKEFFDEALEPINVKLTVKEHENDFISEIESSGNSSMEILTPTSNRSVVSVGDFFKNSYDQLSLKLSPNGYFNFNTGETNIIDHADLKKFLLLDVEILCIL